MISQRSSLGNNSHRPSLILATSHISGDSGNRCSGIFDVVIPASLIPNRHIPYPQESRRISKTSDIETGRVFNAQVIAYHHKQEVKQVMREKYVRSASIAIGALNRSRAIGHDSHANDYVVAGNRPLLRKTSLTASQERHFGQPTSPAKHQPLQEKKKARNLSVIAETTLSPLLERRSELTGYFDSFHFGASHRSYTCASSPSSPTHIPFIPRISSPAATYKRISYDEERDIGNYRSNVSFDDGKASVIQRAGSVVAGLGRDVQDTMRRSSLHDVYERAKLRGKQLQRRQWVMYTFEYICYTILLAFVYFVLIGAPLWNGSVWWLYWVFVNKFSVTGTWVVFVGIAAIYAYAPLLILFEKDPEISYARSDPSQTPGVHDTALIIPCYKSENIIGPTLEAALKIFPASHIFIIANGNSPTPLDNTEDVCSRFGVNHVWSPIGSKIVAQYVGCYAAKGFKNVLLIDDDCALPPNFPIVSDRMTDQIKCIGYTIKSVGPGSSRGNLCQQAQDLEYKISGIQRALAGKMGSATFPHGAIALWDSKFLIQTFARHPGFNISEDWFFGHVARELGSRITMCTSVMIETETPSAVFFSSGGSRGGFGEMTIFKQRFLRWNFFFVNGLWFNAAYIAGSWRLGWREIGTKLFVFQEVYETLLYLLAPFVIPISFLVRPSFTGYTLLGTVGLYFLNVFIFNEVHLRLKNERVPSKCVYLYYMPYKVVLTMVNIASCYWSLYKYAKYFARRHPRIIEDEKAVDVVLRMQETVPVLEGKEIVGRRMSVVAIGTQLHGSVVDDSNGEIRGRKATITTMGPDLEPDPLSAIQGSDHFPRRIVPDQSQIVSITMDDRTFSLTSQNSGIPPNVVQNPRMDSATEAYSEKSSSPLHHSPMTNDMVSGALTTPKQSMERKSTESTRSRPPSRTIPMALHRGYSYQRTHYKMPLVPPKTPLVVSPPLQIRARARDGIDTDDFATMGYGELMAKLAALEENLKGINRRLDGVLHSRV